MDSVEEPPLHNAPVDGMKITVVFEEKDENAVASVAMDVCHKSNGVADSESAEVAAVESNTAPSEDSKCEIKTSEDGKNEAQENVKESAAVSVSGVGAVSEIDNTTEVITSATEKNKDPTDDPSPIIAQSGKNEVKDIDKNSDTGETQLEEAILEIASVAEPHMDRVTFQTEILVESNDNDMIETITEETIIDDHDSTNLLSGLGQSIELSEALRSSDVTDSGENNNCAVRQEVFNKEELLDILEGNDEGEPESLLPPNFNKSLHSKKILETQIALQQLSRLKRTTKKRSAPERLPRSRKSDKTIKSDSIVKIDKEAKTHKVTKSDKADKNVKQDHSQNQKESTEGKTEENIVNVLVKEWDDEEATEAEKSYKLQESEASIESTEEIEKKTQKGDIKEEEEASVRTSIDSTSDGKTPALNKSSDEGQPQRRLGRVIKKKVIFDPDNPDTFTKSKTVNKSKEPSMEKDTTPSKKIKTEQTFQITKTKSPLMKNMQWKKPSPKNCKQNKRLTEVDKLLMDEGAVNMIYQLTPEAPKGKKNMKTKAEFIKKLQSSTPDSKEMKFRERKKEMKYEEGEAKKILGGKHRSSLSGSVKSPSVCEDFEAHSADDSIIYRRHSSSSYSSSCMSPRRLSDVETSNQGSSRNSSQVAQTDGQNQSSTISNRPIGEMFMSDNTDSIRTDTINKDDCLSIKEKLNSKLNLALNKRKRDSSKVDKPSKLKKVMKTDEKTHVNSEDFKYLSINFDQRFAEICVQKPGSNCNIEIIKELEKALQLIELRKDISVTLLSSECGTTYSDLDLRPLLDENMEISTNFAYKMAESIRSLLQAVEQHSKLLCSGMSGRCSGIGLALIGLSDVALASERASFAISPKSRASVAPIEPGVSAFTTYRLLSQPLLNELVVFGRRLTASEALQGGLVSRTLWPENFNEQVQTIAKDIAAQPAQNIWLKKQLLNMKKSGLESTFLAYLEKERDLLVEYWTSVEGQEIIRATYNA